MSDTPRLSALCVVHNEARRLDDCLRGLSFVDQIVVVLDRCTDESKAIVLKYGAKIVEGAWPIEGPRRQAGQKACDGRWIFEIDADERVPEPLAAEIAMIIKARDTIGSGPDWWRIPFDNYIGDHLVRYGWGAQFGVGAKAILYRKGIKSWENQRVHPKVKMDGLCGGTLENRMDHLVDENISDMLLRLDRYTTLRAQDLIEDGDIGTQRKNIARIFGRFYKCYLLRKGYREGILGFIIAICAGLYPILSYAKALEIKNSSKGST
ncbi:MAG: glycosyltransferase family 2 protein [Proteobacteria bacterium]|jgi:glycosyltransferase involved in cell wall biosynthesis|nr:glycosyltransferase family 2 protein [Alphaproteobacteria bacterium]NCC02690.1 glycosyltransferase family 2 protein [Pseudomonadota bacterium]